MEAEKEAGKAQHRPILIIDDDTRIRMSIAELLQLEGYRVATAGNGHEALNRLKVPPLPCLILLDVVMPVMDGFTFRAELMKDPDLAAIPVVVTSSIDEAYQLKGHLQSVAYLQKPFDREQLLEVVKRYCG